MLKHTVGLDILHLLRTYSKTSLSVVKIEDAITEDSTTSTTKVTRIDRLWCETMMNNTTASPDTTLACAQISDSSRHMSRVGMQARTITWQDCRLDTICTSLSLDPTYGVYIHNAPYFSSLSEVKSPLLAFIGKCIPVRCQNRVFDAKLRRALVRVWFFKVKRVKQPKFDDSVLQAVKQIVLFVLLGNYAHCTPGTRPTVLVRYMLYQIFTDKKYERWVVKLFHRCLPLVVLSVRTLMIVSYDHNPALYKILDKHSDKHGLFDLRLFKQIVESGVVLLRKRFERDLCTPGSLLQESFTHLPPWAAHCSLYWVCDGKHCRSMPCPHVVNTLGVLKPSVQQQRKRQRTNKRRRLQGEEEKKEEEEDEEIKAIEEQQQHMTQDAINDKTYQWSWAKDAMHSDLNKLVEHIEKRILDEVSYERSHADFSPLITPLQKHFPLVPLVLKKVSGDHKHEIDESQRKNEKKVYGMRISSTRMMKDRDSQSQIHEHTPRVGEESPEQPELRTVSDRIVDTEHGDRDQLQSDKSGTTELDPDQCVLTLPEDELHECVSVDTRQHLRRFLGDLSIRALLHAVERCGPVGYEGTALRRLVEYFPCFHVDDEAIRKIKDWFDDYAHDAQPVQQIKKQIQRLRLEQPHAYNLLHLSLQLLTTCERRMKLWELPYHIPVAQLEVLKDSKGRVLINDVAFVYCDICQHIYSNLRDPNSVYKNSYRHGLREPSVDFLTGKIYCVRGKQNHYGRCGERELVRIPMIGRVLYFQHKTILLCGQLGCGALMVLDAKNQTYCLVNERGPACMACSAKLNNRIFSMQSLEEKYMSNAHTIECFLCIDSRPHQRRINLPHRNAFVYPFDIHLCPKHHLPIIADAVCRYTANHSAVTTQNKHDNETAVKMIIDRYRDKEQEEKERLQQEARAKQKTIEVDVLSLS